MVSNLVASCSKFNLKADEKTNLMDLANINHSDDCSKLLTFIRDTLGAKVLPILQFTANFHIHVGTYVRKEEGLQVHTFATTKLKRF